MDKETKAFLDANNFKSLKDAQLALDNPDIKKLTVMYFLKQIRAMDIDTKNKLEYSKEIFIPTIHCKDGIVFPVRDLTGGFTGTFAAFNGTDAVTVKPNRKDEQ